MPRYANRVDANQGEIALALTMAGWWVQPTNIMRGKMLDLVACKQGVTVFVECKVPGERLTDSEKKFMETCQGHKIIAYSGQDAVDKAVAILRQRC